MEEMIISQTVDTVEARLRNDEYGIQSIERLKDELTGIAALAYGSGATEGSSGGEGHVGLVGGKVVKFNTHRSEYKSDLTQSELYSKMVDSGEKLRQRLLDLASQCTCGITNGFSELAKDEFENQKKLVSVHDSIGHWSEGIKAESSAKRILTRKAAAQMVTFICKQLATVTGRDMVDEVWGAAKKLAKSTGNVADTQNLLREALAEQENVKQLKKQHCLEESKTLVRSVVDRATEYANTVNQQELPPQPKGAGKKGRLTFKRIAESKPNDWVPQEDFTAAVRYDRLGRIQRAVGNMVSTMRRAFGPEFGLTELFAYERPEDVDDREAAKYPGSEFAERLAAIKTDPNRQVNLNGSFPGVTEKDYRSMLTALRKHFLAIATKPYVVAPGDNPDKANIHALAREFCWRVTLFLDEQISDSNPSIQFEEVDRTKGWASNFRLELDKTGGSKDREFWPED